MNIEPAFQAHLNHDDERRSYEQKDHKAATAIEAAEEQAAWGRMITASVWFDLEKRGLIRREHQVYRLTVQGREAIAAKGAAA